MSNLWVAGNYLVSRSPRGLNKVVTGFVVYLEKCIFRNISLILFFLFCISNLNEGQPSFGARMRESHPGIGLQVIYAAYRVLELTVCVNYFRRMPDLHGVLAIVRNK